MTPDLEAALAGALEVLDSLGLRHAIVGGLAVSAWAEPRGTRDVDLWVELPSRLRPEVRRGLVEAGYDVPAMDAELQRFGVFRSRHLATGVFVDIFDAVGPMGASILAQRKEGRLGGVHVWIAAPNDLALLKAYSDRPRDFDDLVALLRHAEIDVHELEHWARRLDESIGADEVSARVREAVKAARSAPRR